MLKEITGNNCLLCERPGAQIIINKNLNKKLGVNQSMDVNGRSENESAKTIESKNLYSVACKDCGEYYFAENNEDGAILIKRVDIKSLHKEEGKHLIFCPSKKFAEEIKEKLGTEKYQIISN